ncbi:MAG: hypothetical protein WDN31_22235, partial [Hyphomicrobium sp.]
MACSRSSRQRRCRSSSLYCRRSPSAGSRLGSLNAALGFIPLFGGEKADTIDLPPPGAALTARTALLFPVYHEDPARIAGTIQAVTLELQSMDAAGAFDIFILSDTRDEREGAAEESAYRALRHRLKDIIPVYYRRRRENHARKSGNIKDWVRRFGGAYEHFVILDGDSVMSGTTLVRLALAMQRDQMAGLIQTVPRLTGATTLLQYLTQFASNVYGPLVAAGLAFWHRDQGNYLGAQRHHPHAGPSPRPPACRRCRTRSVWRRHSEPRLRRGGAARPRRLGRAHGADRRRLLRGPAADASRRRRPATGAGRRATCSTSASSLAPTSPPWAACIC